MKIVVSGINTEKLLEIPKLQTSTEKMMAKAVVQALQQWKGVYRNNINVKINTG